MLNQIIIVGKLVDIKPIDDLFYYAYIRVDRPFKELKGGYKIDILPVKIWKGIMKSLNKEKYSGFLCSVGGRIEVEDDDKLTLVAEKFEFLGRQDRFIKGGK